jgi:hypothetical protein
VISYRFEAQFSAESHIYYKHQTFLTEIWMRKRRQGKREGSGVVVRIYRDNYELLSGSISEVVGVPQFHRVNRLAGCCWFRMGVVL